MGVQLRSGTTTFSAGQRNLPPAELKLKHLLSVEMSDYPTRFVSEVLSREQLSNLMLALPEILATVVTDDPVLRVRYGFGCKLHPALQYIGMEVPLSRLSSFMADSIRQEIVIPGECDLYIDLPKGRMELVFCHEGHFHSSGGDWQLETALWTRGMLAELPLSDCPGIGLRMMAAKKT